MELHPRVPALNLTALAGCLLVLSACASGGSRPAPTPLSIGFAKGTPPLTLEEANRTWKGARCELLRPIGLGRGPDDEGFYWNRVGGVVVPGEGRGVGFNLYAKVTGRDRLGALAHDQKLQPGARLIAEGWDFFDPKEQKGPHLNLRLEGTNERVRMEFAGGRRTNTRGLGREKLRELEAWVRLNMFRVEAVSEQLTAPPVAAPAPPAPRVATTMRVIAVSANPARVRAGETVDLIAHYEVAGSADEVLERRSLSQGAQQIWTSEDRLSRAPGSFTSTKPLSVPVDAPPGVYTVRIELVTTTGAQAAGTALFEVVR